MFSFLPILNYNFGNSGILSHQEIEFIYTTSLKAISKSFEELEVSLVSDDLWLHLDKIIETALSSNLRLSFGSITSVELAESLDKELEKHSFPYRIKIFSPAFDKAIAEFYNKKDQYQYLPGVFSPSDFERSQKYSGFPAIKIFPYSFSDSYGFLKALQAPYPELQRDLFRSRILCSSEEMTNKYTISKRITVDEDGNKKLDSKFKKDIYLIQTPYDYQKIRSKFMLNSSIFIFFLPIEVNKTSLIKNIQNFNKNTEIYITGLKNLDAHELKTLPNHRYHLASRVFKYIGLDLLSGSIKILDIEELMHKELAQIKQVYESKS